VLAFEDVEELLGCVGDGGLAGGRDGRIVGDF
jgi:hypothetical protein